LKFGDKSMNKLEYLEQKEKELRELNEKLD
jgi:hypothetical protein